MKQAIRQPDGNWLFTNRKELLERAARLGMEIASLPAAKREMKLTTGKSLIKKAYYKTNQKPKNCVTQAFSGRTYKRKKAADNAKKKSKATNKEEMQMQEDKEVQGMH